MQLWGGFWTGDLGKIKAKHKQKHNKPYKTTKSKLDQKEENLKQTQDLAAVMDIHSGNVYCIHQTNAYTKHNKPLWHNLGNIQSPTNLITHIYLWKDCFVCYLIIELANTYNTGSEAQILHIELSLKQSYSSALLHYFVYAMLTMPLFLENLLMLYTQNSKPLSILSHLIFLTI